MPQVGCRVNDHGADAYVQLQRKGQPINVLDAKWLILQTVKDVDSGIILADERDVTAFAKAFGDPANGTLLLPLYNGRTLRSLDDVASLVTVADQSVNGQITLTRPASGGNVYKQRFYMTKAGAAVTGPYYLVAEGDDGFAAAGITIGNATYPAADAVLFETSPTYDESETEQNPPLTRPAWSGSTAALAGVGAGDVDDGDHYFAVVDVAKWDTWTARQLAFYAKPFDRTTGEGETWLDDDALIVVVREL